ncbi:hypothetical protein [Solimonas variicoloris]|uniref:hypothetical protein n=1 Tax=Solimonas variicoloris TaxID=254408 RepID=UPI003F4FBF7F
MRERLATLAAQGVVLVPPSELIARYEPRPRLQPTQLRISPWGGASAPQGAPAEY